MIDKKAMVLIDNANVERLHPDKRRHERDGNWSKIYLDYRRMVDHYASLMERQIKSVKVYDALPQIYPQGSVPESEYKRSVKAHRNARKKLMLIRDQNGVGIYRDGWVHVEYCKNVISAHNDRGEPLEIPCNHPDRQQKLVDTTMVKDIVVSCLTDEEVDTYIVFSGDTDIIPALNVLKERHKRILIVCEDSGKTARFQETFGSSISLVQKMELFSKFPYRPKQN